MNNIHYQLTLHDYRSHRLALTLNIRQPNADGQMLRLPKWIPGSYMIRDFSKHIINVRATTQDGRPLAVTVIDPSHWQVAPHPGSIQVHYEVYAWDLSVRGAHYDQQHAFLNGTSCFLEVVGQSKEPHSLDLLADEWAQQQAWSVATTLPALALNPQGFGHYHASNYDELIDHPIEMAAFKEVRFDAGGIEHRMVLTGVHDADLDRIAQDLAPICEAQLAFFGEPAPFERYIFMVMVTGDGYGGLEHRSSTALICSRDSLPYAGMDKPSDKYLEFLELCSHEYFHSWNVKRIQPAILQQSDLQSPASTQLLWWFEGATSYYDLLFLYRAGTIDQTTYLQKLAEQLTRVYRMPGRFQQTLADSSKQAWTKLYQQDENAPNAIISYYTKGALAVIALDLTLRMHSQGQKSLDDLMRLLWRDYGIPQAGLVEDHIEQLAGELVAADLTEFFQQALHSTADLPLAELFAQVGINFALRPPVSNPDLGGTAKENPNAKPYLNLGANLVNSQNQSVKLTHVWHERPAHKAGLSGGDEIIALDGLRMSSVAQLDSYLQRRPLGDRLNCHYFRRDELAVTHITLDSPPADRVVLTAEQTYSWPEK
ncbi:M61 family metallopeptidase [Thiomicrospira cyclica]|uniref:Peptidase M61 domain protein n=1 Tax=Thiomicrospira cyclica (strain DSM 14477 / JCM 11371 / ALM1) TaxID=717773 RepID=F6DBQ6_THICA|nr:PDZ domain-containing protein [Thiomicrospira cyclica]AEG31292.1 peptidase M61 domain protein [Thiomicrospira cyclica ALM1]